jgi:hypothetical protein
VDEFVGPEDAERTVAEAIQRYGVEMPAAAAREGP